MLIKVQRNIAIVGIVNVFDVGKFAKRHNAHKFFVLIEIRIGFVKLFQSHAVGRFDINGRQNTAVDRQKVRYERHIYLFAVEKRQRLFNFRRMAVAGCFVSGKSLVGVRKMRVLRKAASGARHAALGIENDPVRRVA